MGKRTRDGMGKRITNTYPLGTSDPLARRWWCDDHIQLQIPCSWFPSSRCCCLFSSLLYSSSSASSSRVVRVLFSQLLSNKTVSRNPNS
jgi:hypothetical protein